MRILTLAIVLLTGCSSVVPSTVARLSALSPLEADPSDIAVALDLPEGLDVREGSAKLLVSAERTDTNKTINEQFILARTQGSDGTIVYQIAEEDHERMSAIQTTAMNWEAENDRATTGSISVGLEGCTIGVGPAEDATISIMIRTEESAKFLPLVRNAPLKQVFEEKETALLKPCA